MADGLLCSAVVRKLVCVGVVLALYGGASEARAQGGPPLITDDPDTPGPGYWEINVATIFERHSHSHTLELPRVDANYGVGRRIQLKLEMPWSIIRCISVKSAEVFWNPPFRRNPAKVRPSSTSRLLQ